MKYAGSLAVCLYRDQFRGIRFFANGFATSRKLHLVELMQYHATVFSDIHLVLLSLKLVETDSQYLALLPFRRGFEDRVL